jgi:hypothetical protein
VKFIHSLFVFLLLSGCYVLLLFPASPFPVSGYIGRSGDELQAAWNMWWVSFALEQGLSPFKTLFLHAPLGIEFWGQPLAAPHGIFYFLTKSMLSLPQAYNTLVYLGFALTGLFAYWLGRDLGLKPVFAFLAAYFTSFSNFHFQHLHGHLEFISMQWLLLYMVFLHRLFTQPTLSVAVVAALALTLVTISNSYYAVSAVLVSVCFSLTFLRKLPELFTRQPLAWVLFGTLAVGLCGTYALSFFEYTRDNPLLPGHSVALGSLHPSSIFVPGQFWRWGQITQSVWSLQPGYTFEHSVSLGFALVGLISYAALSRQIESPAKKALGWYFLFSLGLALGPKLFIQGEWRDFPLPFDILDFILPFSSLSGVPVRLFAGAGIAGAFLAAFGAQQLYFKKRYLVLSILMLLACIEQTPKAPEISHWKAPAYAEILKSLPIKHTQIVADLVSKGGDQLAAQTVYKKPMLFGYTARISKQIDAQNRTFRKLLGREYLTALCEIVPLAYIAAPNSRFRASIRSEQIVYEDAENYIFKPCVDAD